MKQDWPRNRRLFTVYGMKRFADNGNGYAPPRRHEDWLAGLRPSARVPGYDHIFKMPKIGGEQRSGFDLLPRLK